MVRLPTKHSWLLMSAETNNGDQAAAWARIDRAARRAGAHRGDPPAQKMTAMFMGATNPESEWGSQDERTSAERFETPHDDAPDHNGY